MEGNVVSAAKWFGFSLIISSIILVVGLSMAVDRSSRRISSGLASVGSNNAIPNIKIPSKVGIELYPQGALRVVNDYAVPSSLDITLRPEGQLKVSVDNTIQGELDILQK